MQDSSRQVKVPGWPSRRWWEDIAWSHVGAPGREAACDGAPSNPPKPTGERQPSAMQWKWRSLLLLDLLPRPTQAITRDSSGRNHLPCLPCAQQCYFQHNERITDRKVGKYKSVLCICTVGEMYAYVGFLVLTAPQFISILTGLVKVTAACCINDTICGE